MKRLLLCFLTLLGLSLPLRANHLESYSAELARFHLAPTRQSYEHLEAENDQLAPVLKKKGNYGDLNAAVFLARAAEKYHWSITGKGPISETAREIVKGESKQAKYVRDNNAVTSDKLDIWWASFFATGDNKYLAMLLNRARYPRSGEHAADFMVPAAAAWSFKANCRQDPTVLAFAKEALAKDTYPQKTVFLKECIAAAPHSSQASESAPPSEALPTRMTKMITERLGQPAGSFAAQPIVTYRAGNKYCRTEEAMDSTQGIHGLSIINEPNLWMINLADNTGRHIVDPGPTFNVQLPIFWHPKREGEPDVPKVFEGLEFGKELQFFHAHHTGHAGVREIEGKSYHTLSFTQGATEATLSFDPKTDKPFEVAVTNNGKPELAIRYLAYQTDLPFQKSLFAPPQNVELTEAQ